jgi:UDP-N-acetylmuramyl pentapeptide phosphotransferase/UDP-N-acetylglucosamine-1-phosphate transferase
MMRRNNAVNRTAHRWLATCGPPVTLSVRRPRMSLLALIASAVVTYAIAAWSLQALFHVDPSSNWYWLPFVASFALLVVGFVLDYRKENQPRIRLAATLVVSLVLTGMADLVVAVVRSCFEGVCI